MKVYFVRHGESETNAGGLRLGAETPLTELGKKQAGEIAKRLVGYKIDKFISSDYRRAKQTSEIISEQTSLPIEYSNLFVELKKPTELNGLVKDDPEAKRVLGVIWDNYIEGDWRYSDEETPNELIARADKALTHLTNLSPANGNILVSTHGNFLRFMVAVAIFGPDLDLGVMKKWQEGTMTHNAGFTIMEFKPGEEDNLGKWRLVTWNDHAHL